APPGRGGAAGRGGAPRPPGGRGGGAPIGGQPRVVAGGLRRDGVERDPELHLPRPAGEPLWPAPPRRPRPRRRPGGRRRPARCLCALAGPTSSGGSPQDGPGLAPHYGPRPPGIGPRQGGDSSASPVRSGPMRSGEPGPGVRLPAAARRSARLHGSGVAMPAGTRGEAPRERRDETREHATVPAPSVAATGGRLVDTWAQVGNGAIARLLSGPGGQIQRDG